MKYFSLFSGIGAPEKSLDRLKINYELAGYSEIDKYASKSYSAIHKAPESLNFGDITKINEKELPKDIDLITYGFPCQDISNAGKMKGLKLVCSNCGTEMNIPDDYTEKIKRGQIVLCEKCEKKMKLTRSGLFFEALRIIEETQPKIAIAENVKNLTSKKFSEQLTSKQQNTARKSWARRCADIDNIAATSGCKGQLAIMQINSPGMLPVDGF